MSDISITTMTSDESRFRRPGRSLWSDAMRRVFSDKAAVACFIVICAYAAIAIITPFAIPDWDTSFDYNNTNASPSWQYWLGTDEFGRSILEKTFLAAHVSMSVALWTNLLAVPLGMMFGAVAGYYGRWIDDFIVWIYTTLNAIPGIILLIALKFAFNGKVLLEWTKYNLDKYVFGIHITHQFDFSVNMDGMVGIVIALGVLNWTGVCRLVRAETLKIRELDYVMAARATGHGGFGILLRHVMPNVMHLGIICFSLGFVGAITSEVILSYLGLGIQNAPSWGRMINAARSELVVGRWVEFAAAVGATFIIVLAWNIFGDRLRDALDPRLKNV